MSTLEKLFVQIFDRKNWITDQLRQQRDHYDQYLASTLLINGIRPPSWLWGAELGAGSAELKELKKEDLISGLLFPPPRANIPSTFGNNTLYNRADVTASYGQPSEALFTETCASNKYFNVGERSTLVPKCHLNELDLGCALNCVPELDHSITSPQQHTDAKMSDTYYEPDQSLARIQRSRSRQKAIELRNSAKVKSKKRPRKESCTSAYTGRITRSRVSKSPNQVTMSRSATQRNSIDELQTLNYVDQDDGPNTVIDTQMIIQSSMSGKNDVELCNFAEANTEKHPRKGSITDECSFRITRPQTTDIQINSAKELLRPDNTSKIPSGIVTRSRFASINSEACSINSRSKMLGACPGVGMDILFSKLPSDNITFVEPKHLVFDDLKDCILKEVCIPALEEKWDGSPEMQAISLGPTELLRNDTISDDLHKRHYSLIDEQLLVKDHNMESVQRKGKRRASAEDHEEDMLDHEKSERGFYCTSTGKTPNLVHLSSRTGTSEIYEDEVAEESPKRKKISKHVSTELSREVTISDSHHERCDLHVDEQLLEKVQNMEAAEREEEPKAFSGDHRGEKLEIFRTEKSGCDLYPSSSTSKSLNLSALSSKKGQHDTSEDLVADTYPENKIISKQVPIESLKKVTIAHDSPEKIGFYVELLGRDNTVEVVNREEERRASSKTHDGERFEFVKEKSEFSFHSSGKISNASRLLSSKGTAEIYEDVEADLSTESNKISKQVTSPLDHLTTMRVGRPSSLASQLREVDISLLDEGMDPRKNNFGENCTRTLDVVPKKMLPEDCKLDTDACDYSKKSMSLDFNNVTGLSLVDKPEVSLGAQETEFSYVVAADAVKRSVLRQAVTPETAQMHIVRQEAPYFLRSYSNPEKNAGFSKSNGSYFENKSIRSEKAFNSGWEKSWPQYKRKKIDVGSSNMFPSPRLLAVRQPQQIHEDNTCRSLENGLGAVMEFQHFSVSCDLEVDHSNVIVSPGTEMCQSEKCHKKERFGSSLKLQTKESEVVMEGRDQDADNPLADNPLGADKTQVPTSLCSSMKNEAHSDSHDCFEDEMGMKDSTSAILYIKGQFASEDEENSPCLESALNLGSMVHISSMGGTMNERISNLGEQFSYCPVGSPHYECHDLIGVPKDNILPSISGDKITFDKSDLPSTTSERISILEQLCRSTSLLTPLPRPSMYELDTMRDIYKSLPNGLLERTDLRNAFLFHDDDINQLKTNYNLMGVEVEHNFLGRSCSNFIPSSSYNVGNTPYTPPVGKLSQRITSISAGLSSQKQANVNPELTCFRIDEDTITSEENGNLNEAVDSFDEGISPIEMDDLNYREPLIDMTNVNPPASVSVTEMLHDRSSLDSVNMKLNFHGAQMHDWQKLSSSYDNGVRCKEMNKENPSSSIGGNGVGKASEPLHNRFSRPKLSGKASEKKGSQNLLDKGCKRTNIVSNISSFIPLVQQKAQPAAVFTGKRDIKVKALETAEAAKRIEEKRERDRKMKKEATKLERARLEQEKIRQLELQRKKKEEERRIKEAEVAARKRQREEEERKGRERKRKCIEEARKQQKEQVEKLRTEKQKELRCRTADERECQRKELQNEEKKHQRTDKERERADCMKKMETDTRIAMDSEVDARKALSNLGKVNEDGSSVTELSREQSYEISPYQGSDDEDEEEDGKPKNKFIPLWAREKHLASFLPSIQQIDPYEIFHPASFCCLDEVLLQRKNPK